MVNPIEVSMFTPVVEENKTPVSALPAIYLAPLFCNREVAVIIPGAVDADGNQDCNRKELKSSMAGTVLKVISYFTIILPLLAIVLNLLIRCGTAYQYNGTPQVQVPQNPGAPAANPNSAQLVQGFLDMGMSAQDLQALKATLNDAAQRNAIDEAIRRLSGQAPAPQAPAAPAAVEVDQAIVQNYLGLGMSAADLQGLKAEASDAEKRAIDEAVRRLSAQAPAPQAAAPAAPAAAPAVADEVLVEYYLAIQADVAELRALKTGAERKDVVAIDEAIRRRSGQLPAIQAPAAPAAPATAAVDEAAVQGYLDMGMSAADLQGLKAGSTEPQKRAIDEAIRRKTTQVAQAQLTAAPAGPAAIPAAPQVAPQAAPQAAPVVAAAPSANAQVEALEAVRAAFAIMNEEELRSAYIEVIGSYDLTAPGVVREAQDKNIKAIQARAKDLGIDLEQKQTADAIKARLAGFEAIKNDIEAINAAWMKEALEAKNDNDQEQMVARLNNTQKLEEYATALGKTLPFAPAEKPAAAPTATPAAPTAAEAAERAAERQAAVTRLATTAAARRASLSVSPPGGPAIREPSPPSRPQNTEPAAVTAAPAPATTVATTTTTATTTAAPATATTAPATTTRAAARAPATTVATTTTTATTAAAPATATTAPATTTRAAARAPATTVATTATTAATTVAPATATTAPATTTRAAAPARAPAATVATTTTTAATTVAPATVTTAATTTTTAAAAPAQQAATADNEAKKISNNKRTEYLNAVNGLSSLKGDRVKYEAALIDLRTKTLEPSYDAIFPRAHLTKAALDLSFGELDDQRVNYYSKVRELAPLRRTDVKAYNAEIAKLKKSLDPLTFEDLFPDLASATVAPAVQNVAALPEAPVARIAPAPVLTPVVALPKAAPAAVSAPVVTPVVPLPAALPIVVPAAAMEAPTSGTITTLAIPSKPQLPKARRRPKQLTFAVPSPVQTAVVPVADNPTVQQVGALIQGVQQLARRRPVALVHEKMDVAVQEASQELAFLTAEVAAKRAAKAKTAVTSEDIN